MDNKTLVNEELNIEETTFSVKDLEVSGRTLMGIMGVAAGAGLATSENAGSKAIGYALIAGCGIGLMNKIIRSIK